MTCIGPTPALLALKLAMADVAFDMLLETGVNISPFPVQRFKIKLRVDGVREVAGNPVIYPWSKRGMTVCQAMR